MSLRRISWRVPLAVALAALAACSSSGSGGGGTATTAAPAPPATTAPASRPTSKLTLTSPVFKDGAPIPPRYTCKGDNLSPPLQWSRMPAGTRELALVVDDPDAPGGTFVHWVISGIRADLAGLAEDEVPPGATEARPYTGPCPPSGPAHHYRFTLYALGRSPGIKAGADPQQAIAAIQAAAIAQGRLVGTFRT